MERVAHAIKQAAIQAARKKFVLMINLPPLTVKKSICLFPFLLSLLFSPQLCASSNSFQRSGLAVISDTDGYTNIRSGPGDTFPIIGKVRKREEFYFGTDTSNLNWLEVQKLDGMIGFMHKSRIKLQQLLRKDNCEGNCFNNHFDSVNTWNRIFELYIKCHVCLDGVYFSECFSYVIGNMLADRWNSINVLSDLADKDTSFMHFVLDNIGFTLSNEVLNKILSNARYHCTNKYSKVCGKIYLTTSGTIRELDELKAKDTLYNAKK